MQNVLGAAPFQVLRRTNTYVSNGIWSQDILVHTCVDMTDKMIESAVQMGEIPTEGYDAWCGEFSRPIAWNRRFVWFNVVSLLPVPDIGDDDLVQNPDGSITVSF